MKMDIVIFLSIIGGFSIIPFMMIFSKKIFRIDPGLHQIIFSGFAGFSIWIILLIFLSVPIRNVWDIICGILIMFCALWSVYWLSNLGGGFRINMLTDLSEYKNEDPISVDKWMELYGGLGLDAFLEDRLRSILIPLGIVQEKDGEVRLIKPIGVYFGYMLELFSIIFQGNRRD